MKAILLGSLLLVGACSQALAKPYHFPNERCQLTISDDWHEVTKAGELVSVENANTDSFTLEAVHGDRPIDVQHSEIASNLEKKFALNGMQIISDGSIQFHGRPAVFVVARGTKLTVSYAIYEIVVGQGKDVLCFTMVGDTDPSKDPKFKAILDTVDLAQPAPAAAPTALPTTNAPAK